MILTIVSGFFYSQKKNQATLASTKVTTVPKKEESTLGATTFFSDEQNIFLNPAVTMEDLSQLRTEVDKMAANESKEQQIELLESASNKRYILTALTNLYEGAVRTDGTIDDHARLNPSESEESLTTLKKIVEENQKKDVFYQQVWSLLTKDTVSSSEINIDTEETQVFEEEYGGYEDQNSR